jgi:hypothetical protein
MARQDRDVFNEAIIEAATRFFQRVEAAVQRIPNPPGQVSPNMPSQMRSMKDIRRLVGGG